MKVLLVALSLAVASAHYMELRRLPPKREQLIRDGTWNEAQRMIQLKKLAAKFSGKERLGANTGPYLDPLTDIAETLYIGNINVGTPPQKFSMVLDTGSSNLWIPDQACNAPPQCPGQCANLQGNDEIYCQIYGCNDACCSGSSGSVCANKNVYMANASSTYQTNGQTFSIAYGTGSCNGILGIDTMSFATTPVFTIPQVTFGQATSLADFFKGQPFDGILGLAWPSLAVDRVIPPLQVAIANGQLANQYFTVWMNNDLSDGAAGGTISFGGFDANHCSGSVDTAFWVPLSSKTYWQYHTVSFSVSPTNSENDLKELMHVDKLAAGSIVDAISDTGTSLWAMTDDLFSSTCATLGGSVNEYNLCEASTCDLTQLTGFVSMTLKSATGQSQAFKVSVNNLVAPLGIPGRCIYGIQGGFNQGSLQFINGDTFMRAYCHVFDIKNGRIGLVPSTNK